ncbi:hypothetical protein TRFO_11979 [Tritrichomonas foetus]|uniref:Uncharacterized protein n=1 Tax=Tritrichomonas foetus TaxID=1144522 RepID=A0A1J4J0R3_9EUKA|nr:hypothetical protein TRFO_11979 [Tritrichomonas foetus]|eukprot:OHS93168.1 hypothetical protein TRFO_11979 [Tritrichomonas foetus]
MIIFIFYTFIKKLNSQKLDMESPNSSFITESGSPSPKKPNKRVKLFNPIAEQIDLILTKIRNNLTSCPLPSDLEDLALSLFDSLSDSVPLLNIDYDGTQPLNHNIDPFWNEWLGFRSRIWSFSSLYITDISENFIKEKFEELNIILETINDKEPKSAPLFREYSQAKKEINKATNELEALILENFKGDDASDDKNIQNLLSHRKAIRRVRDDYNHKYKSYFTKSAQDKSISDMQHRRCIALIEDILDEINKLPKQKSNFAAIKKEMSVAEKKLKKLFPITTIPVPDIFIDEFGIYQIPSSVPPSPNSDNRSELNNSLNSDAIITRSILKNSNRTQSINYSNLNNNNSFNNDSINNDSMANDSMNNDSMMNDSLANGSIINDYGVNNYNAKEHHINEYQSNDYGVQSSFANNSTMNSSTTNDSMITHPMMSGNSMNQNCPIENETSSIMPLELSDGSDMPESFKDLSKRFNSSESESSGTPVAVYKKQRTKIDRVNERTPQNNRRKRAVDIIRKVERTPTTDQMRRKSGVVSPKRGFDYIENQNEDQISYSSDNEVAARINPHIKENGLEMIKNVNDTLNSSLNNTSVRNNVSKTNSLKGNKTAPLKTNVKLNNPLKTKPLPEPPQPNIEIYISSCNSDDGQTNNNNHNIHSNHNNSHHNSSNTARSNINNSFNTNINNNNNSNTNTNGSVSIVNNNGNMSNVGGVNNDGDVNKEGMKKQQEIPQKKKSFEFKKKVEQKSQIKGTQLKPKRKSESDFRNIVKEETVSPRKKENETVFDELQRMKDDYQTLLIQLDVAYQENNEIQAEQENLKKELAEMEQGKIQLIESIEDLRNKLEISENENSELKKMVASLKNDIRQNDQTLIENDENPFLSKQIQLYEEAEIFYQDEIARLLTLQDSLTKRITKKSKDESLYLENSRLHREKDQLYAKLQVLLRESKNESELLLQFRREKAKNDLLIEELRTMRQKLESNLQNDDKKMLFDAKSEKIKMQIESQKLNVRNLHLKAKIRRLKMHEHSNYQPVKEIENLQNEIAAIRNSFESVQRWGYDLQIQLFNEQAKSEFLEKTVDKLNKKAKNPNFDIDTAVMVELREKIQENHNLLNENESVKSALIELYYLICNEDLTDDVTDVQVLLDEIRQHLSG